MGFFVVFGGSEVIIAERGRWWGRGRRCFFFIGNILDRFKIGFFRGGYFGFRIIIWFGVFVVVIEDFGWEIFEFVF